MRFSFSLPFSNFRNHDSQFLSFDPPERRRGGISIAPFHRRMNSATVFVVLFPPMHRQLRHGRITHSAHTVGYREESTTIFQLLLCSPPRFAPFAQTRSRGSRNYHRQTMQQRIVTSREGIHDDVDPLQSSSCLLSAADIARIEATLDLRRHSTVDRG